MPNITQVTIAGLKPTGKDYFLRDDNLRGFGIKVTAKGSASYIVEARVKGSRTVRKAIGRVDLLPLDDAKNAARGLLLSLKKGIDVARVAPVEELPPESLGQALATYLATRRHQLAAATIRDYKSTLIRCFSDWLAKPIGSISERNVTERYGKLLDEGLSLAYVAKAFRNLKAILNSTSLSQNPVAGLRKQGLVRQAPARSRYLSGAEVRYILFARSEHPETVHNYRTYDLIIFYMITGVRRNEALNLLWEDVDDKSLTIKKTKNKRPHRIPIVGFMEDCLGERGNPKDRVFGFTDNSFRTAEAKAKWELGFPKWTVHDLRRTFAEHLNLIGYDASQIAMALNHTPVGVTSTSYLSGQLAKTSAITQMYKDLQRQFLAYELGQSDDGKISDEKYTSIVKEFQLEWEQSEREERASGWEVDL